MPFLFSFRAKADLFTYHLKKTPQAPFLHTPKKTFTYQRFHEKILSFKKALLSENLLGFLSPPFPVAFAISLSSDALAMLIALYQLKKPTLLLNPLLPPKSLLPYLKQLHIHLFMVSEPSSYFLQFPFPKPIKLLTLSSLTFQTAKPSLPLPIKKPSLKKPSLKKIKKTFLQKPLHYLLTSGSSQTPKIATLSLQNHLSNAKQVKHHFHLKASDTWLLKLPLYHVSGLSIVFRCLLVGAAIFLSPLAISSTLFSHPFITHLSMVESQFKQSLADHPSALQIPKVILLGGSLLSKQTLSLVHQFKNLYPTYGMTEMASQVATYCPKKKKLKILHSVKLKIKNQQIFLKGPSLFLGYAKTPHQLSPALDSSGYFPSGDHGQKLNHHYLHLFGRKDNLFISGGENIRAEEIEAILLSLNPVKNALVIPIPHPKWTHIPIAILDLHLPKKKTFKATCQWIQTKLPSLLPKYKIPSSFYPFPKKYLPKQANWGKIKRKQIQTYFQTKLASLHKKIK